MIVVGGTWVWCGRPWRDVRVDHGQLIVAGVTQVLFVGPWRSAGADHRWMIVVGGTWGLSGRPWRPGRGDHVGAAGDRGGGGLRTGHRGRRVVVVRAATTRRSRG